MLEVFVCHKSSVQQWENLIRNFLTIFKSKKHKGLFEFDVR